MATLMLAGAKLGDILGRDRTFAIGLAIYGVGSLTTALSPNLTVLLLGWSLVEGLGAALVMPAIVSLIAATYSGPQRALAFGIVGGVAGAAIAAGPLIGGWVTTEFSWRYVFAGETVIVAVILLQRKRLLRSPAIEHPPKLDVVGVRSRPSALACGLRNPQEQRVGLDRAARRPRRSTGERSLRSGSRSCRSSSLRAWASWPRSPSGRSDGSARAATRCSTARCSRSGS